MHWGDSFPCKIIASVILKDNKIHRWKIGQYSVGDKYNIETLTKQYPSYSYQEKEFIAMDDKQYNKIFTFCSRQYFRQWKLHEKHMGGSPFVDDFIPEDMLGRKIKIIEPSKIGN